MKRFRAIAASALFWTGLSGSVAAPTNSNPTFSERDVIETWGWIVSQQEKVAGLELNTNELAAFTKGFVSGVAGQVAPYDLWKANPDLERLGKARRAKLVRTLTERNEAEARKFFARLQQQTNIIGLPGGLLLEPIQAGTGPKPQPRQAVKVRYHARLLDGTEFAKFGPADVLMLTNHAPFAAWVEALHQLNPGAIANFYVPPPLPEKEADRWGIPPGSTMVFTVELLDVREATQQELTDALVPPAPDSELPASGYTDAELFETWGWWIAQRTRAAQFHLTTNQLSALLHGVESGVTGNASRFELSAIVLEVEKFVNTRRKEAHLAAQKAQRVEMETLFAKLKADPKVVELSSGLRYEILQPGNGPKPQWDQFVKVKYTGRLIDGRIFDQTDPTLGPLDIKVGSVIAGWNEGIQKIGKGGKIKLYIPPALGYGEVATGGIPPNSTLIFEIELLDIRDTLEGPKPH